MKKHYPFLRLLASSHPAQKRALIKSANNAQIDSICEICLNILNGNVSVDKKKLEKDLLRMLFRKTCSSQKTKQYLLNQSGGFLPAPASALISALSSIFGSIISKKLM